MLTHHHATSSQPKRVVVVGASGFVGSTIVTTARAAKIPTLAITRRQVDLLATDAALALAKQIDTGDSVVFVSAIAPARTAEQLVTNLRMAETACKAFAEVPVAHLVYISSDAVYADDAIPVTECSLVAPSTLHGMMHAARELMFRTEYRGPFAVLRPTLIYGAADPHSGYGPNRFRRQAMEGKPITIFGEGEEKRDHVVVEDVARLVLRILLRRSVGALNAATGVATSFNDIAHMVAAQFMPPAPVQSVPRPGPRPHLLHRFFNIAGCYKDFPDFHFEAIGQGLARVHREAMARP
jgi:nucleoside-diphosphate-sugar epimerase